MFGKTLLAAMLTGGAVFGAVDASAADYDRRDRGHQARIDLEDEEEFASRERVIVQRVEEEERFAPRKRVIIKHVDEDEDFRPRKRVVIKHVYHHVQRRDDHPRERVVIKHVYRDRPHFDREPSRTVVKHVYRGDRY